MATATKIGVGFPSKLDLRFSAAEKFFADKVTMTRAEFDTLAAEAQVYAFTVAHVTSMQIIAGIQKEVERAIIDGTTLADFKKAMTGIMAKHGWSGLTPWHTETIFRTNVQMAYGVGQLEGLQGTEDAFPYWEYSAINDSRVRPSHFALNGRIYPANHAFWKLHFPPWDYNCRCDVIPRTAAQAGDKRVHTDKGPPVENAFSGPGAAQNLIETQNPKQIAEAIMPRTFSPEQIDMLLEQLGGEPLPLTEEGFLSSPQRKLAPVSDPLPVLPKAKTVDELLAMKPADLTPEEREIRRKAYMERLREKHKTRISEEGKAKRAAAKAAKKAGPATGNPLERLSKLDYAAGDLAGVHIPSDETLIEGNHLSVRQVEDRGGRRFYEFYGKTTSGELQEYARTNRAWEAAGKREYWGTKKGTVLREGSAMQSRNFRPTEAHAFGNDRVKRFQLDSGIAEFRVDQTRWYQEVWMQGEHSGGTIDTAAVHSFRIRVPISGDDAVDFAALRKVVGGTPLEAMLKVAPEEAQRRAGAIRWIVQEKKYFIQERGYRLTNPWKQFPAGAYVKQADLWAATLDELRAFAEGESIIDFDPEAIEIRNMPKLGYSAAKRKLKDLNYEDVRIWHSIYHAGPEAAANIIEEGRLVSSLNRMRIGLEGVMNTEDMQSGGADSVFFRIAHKNTAAGSRFSDSFHGGGIKFIYKADELERLDVYAFRNDKYGRAYGRQAMEDRLSVPKAILGQAVDYESSNEVMFRHGVTLDNLIEIRVGPKTDYPPVDAEVMRERLLRVLRDRGINKINGRSIEDVVKVSSERVSELWR